MFLIWEEYFHFYRTYFDAPQASVFVVDADGAIGEGVTEGGLGKRRQKRDGVVLLHLGQHPVALPHLQATVLGSRKKLQSARGNRSFF